MGHPGVGQNLDKVKIWINRGLLLSNPNFIQILSNWVPGGQWAMGGTGVGQNLDKVWIWIKFG